MIKSKKNDWVLIYLIFYIFWGWFLTKSIYANTMLVYVSFLALLVGFICKCFKTTSFSLTRKANEANLWIPFYMYAACRLLLLGDIQNMSYWLIAGILIMMSAKYRIIDKLPTKIILGFGLFACVGILVQIFLPSFYYARVAPIFVNDLASTWADSGYGFAGFTYQLAMTAEMLVISLIFLLAYGNKYISSKVLIIGLVILFIICTFLTGKRMNSVLAIFMVMLYLIFNGKVNKKLVFIILIILSIAGVSYFLANADVLGDSMIFRRFTYSIELSNSGGDLDSGRNFLWNKAIELYNSNPLFGIGPGKFVTVSRTGTDVHNMYLQCLCEYGLLGMLLFCVPLVYCLLSTFSLLRKSKNSSTYILYLSFALQLNYMLEGITENTNTNLCGFIMYAVGVAIFVDYKYRYRYEY